MLQVNKIRKKLDSSLMSSVASSQNLDAGFDAVYKNKKNNYHNNDIWYLNKNWNTQRQDIQTQLEAGEYNLEPVKVKHYKRKSLSIWTAKDTDLFKDVYHLIVNGGVEQATTDGINTIELRTYKHLIRSDVENFYASTNHDILLRECTKYIKDKHILKIIKQYDNSLEDYKGEYIHITQAISKGYPLSPLMGPIMLKSLDNKKSANVKYIRFIDDWVIFTKTKAVLGKCVSIIHKVMKELKM